MDVGTGYQNPGAVFSQLKKYINDLDGFSGGELGTSKVSAQEIQSKALELYISPGATAAQLAEIEAAARYADDLGMSMTVEVVPF